MNIRTLFEQDPELMGILRIIAELGLKDSWLAAGTLRNYIWNILSDRAGLENASDIDVVFYDSTMSYEESLMIESDLNHGYSNYKWEVKNQAYMHVHSPNTAPYQSTCHAVSQYPETCTAIAARLDENGDLELFLPYGIDDIINFIVQPTPHFLADSDRMEIYRDRQIKKNWKATWSRLEVRYF